LISYSFIANFFATIFVGVGVAFGSVLWGGTPPARFEPIEIQHSSATAR
jgi:hypothetical protein